MGNDKPTPTKRRVGRPKMRDRVDPTNISEIKRRIAEQQNKFAADCADNLEKLYKVMYQTAIGTNKKASATNQLSAAKFCIETANDYLENEELGPPAPPPEKTQESEKAKVSSLLDL